MIDGACETCYQPDGNKPEKDNEGHLYHVHGEFPDACRLCDGDLSRCTDCFEGYTAVDGKCVKVRRQGGGKHRRLHELVHLAAALSV
jgi:hypothetical protein